MKSRRLMVTILALLLIACSPSPTGSRAPTATSPDPALVSSPSPGTGWLLVAVGDSVMSAGSDTRESYPWLLAGLIERQTSVPVTVEQVRADTTAEVLTELGTGGHLRDLIARADIVTMTVGANDANLDATYPVGTCAVGGAPADCLSRVNPTATANLEAILVSIDAIRAGRPIAIRITSPDYNPFIGWSGAPSATFGLDFYRQVADAEAAATCDAALRHDAKCVDLVRLFNGPAGSADAKLLLDSDHLHPSLAGRTAIAEALFALGLAPLQ
jgi:lysophospholipase L1-like esterase